MKLVSTFPDAEEAHEVSDRMRKAGVMTIIPSSGSIMVGLWVVYDDQFYDAIELLDNENHIPSRVLSHSEMERLEGDAKEQFPGQVNSFLKKFAVICLVIILATIIAFYIWKS